MSKMKLLSSFQLATLFAKQRCKCYSTIIIFTLASPSVEPRSLVSGLVVLFDGHVIPHIVSSLIFYAFFSRFACKLLQHKAPAEGKSLHVLR